MQVSDTGKKERLAIHICPGKKSSFLHVPKMLAFLQDIDGEIQSHSRGLTVLQLGRTKASGQAAVIGWRCLPTRVLWENRKGGSDPIVSDLEILSATGSPRHLEAGEEGDILLFSEVHPAATSESARLGRKVEVCFVDAARTSERNKWDRTESPEGFLLPGGSRLQAKEQNDR